MGMLEHSGGFYRAMRASQSRTHSKRGMRHLPHCCFGLVWNQGPIIASR
jgi:hypothetical protein